MEQPEYHHISIHKESLPASLAPGDFLATSQTHLDAATSAEKATFWRDTTLSNLELLRATFITHAFAPHMHEGYAIGIVDQGAERFKYRKSTHVAPQGSIVVIHPGEMHTGEAVNPSGWTYRMLYPEIALLQRAAAEVLEKPGAIPFFPSPVIFDPFMARLLSHMHMALATSPSALERESLLTWTLAHLIRRHAQTAPARLTTGKEHASMLKVRAYLEEHFTENISLQQLAALADLSPFYFLRVFRETVGLPPHHYLTQIRVAHAKNLISASVPLVEVAAAVGFTDQSHLNRHFKALVGITPGHYARGSR